MTSTVYQILDYMKDEVVFITTDRNRLKEALAALLIPPSAIEGRVTEDTSIRRIDWIVKKFPVDLEYKSPFYVARVKDIQRELEEKAQ